ncbi:hypothetical protein GOEFS_036_00820 [Gordonia effusa NBRC 100432]|uniref:Uncharacterized protein n=1 Tax=Gordonia effusa NBRC 100432 TaxID=1077974 RepID=H0QXU2_9ACTN|nr:hypothetical protein GOEFS_036_00820 [Gordonia effusa NBRC 100432]
MLIAVSGCDRKQDENDPGQATIAYLNALATGDRNTTLSTTCGPINWFLEKTTDKQFMEFRSSVFGNSKSPKFEVARSKKTGDDYLVVVRQDGVEKPDDALLVSLDQDGHYKVCDSQAEPAGTPAPYSPAP